MTDLSHPLLRQAYYYRLDAKRYPHRQDYYLAQAEKCMESYYEEKM